LRSGDAYLASLREEARAYIERTYWNRGFNNVRIGETAGRQPGEPLVNIAFDIEENRQEIVREVQISGNARTSAS
jgi:outer membrane protein assembly factor BamA